VTQSLNPTSIPPAFPDRTQRPDSDGTFVKNFQELPHSILLTDSLESTLQNLHPDGQYAIGQDCGIYWRETDPPERGAEAPDWFYVPKVPPLLDGEFRRSYVLWREYIVPLIAIEFASGNGSEERDNTPLSRLPEGGNQKPGKFWVYEQIIRIPYYAIYVVKTSELEVYNWVNTRYRRLEPNDRGHYPIDLMGVELGRVHLVLTNMFVGAKHDRIQHGIITNNLSAVMLRPPQKPDAPVGYMGRQLSKSVHAMAALVG
jgi:Uma2 family endonuclease